MAGFVPIISGLLLNINRFVISMTGYNWTGLKYDSIVLIKRIFSFFLLFYFLFLFTTGCSLNTIGFVLNMSGFFLNVLGYSLNVTGFILN